MGLNWASRGPWGPSPPLGAETIAGIYPGLLLVALGFIHSPASQASATNQLALAEVRAFVGLGFIPPPPSDACRRSRPEFLRFVARKATRALENTRDQTFGDPQEYRGRPKPAGAIKEKSEPAPRFGHVRMGDFSLLFALRNNVYHRCCPDGLGELVMPLCGPFDDNAVMPELAQKIPDLQCFRQC